MIKKNEKDNTYEVRNPATNQISVFSKEESAKEFVSKGFTFDLNNVMHITNEVVIDSLKTIASEIESDNFTVENIYDLVKNIGSQINEEIQPNVLVGHLGKIMDGIDSDNNTLGKLENLSDKLSGLNQELNPQINKSQWSSRYNKQKP